MTVDGCVVDGATWIANAGACAGWIRIPWAAEWATGMALPDEAAPQPARTSAATARARYVLISVEYNAQRGQDSRSGCANTTFIQRRSYRP